MVMLISKWCALSWKDRYLLISATALLLSARIALRIVPLRIGLGLLGESSAVDSARYGSSSTAEVDRIRLAIDRASSKIRTASCLTRGMAAAILLRSAH